MILPAGRIALSMRTTNSDYAKESRGVEENFTEERMPIAARETYQGGGLFYPDPSKQVIAGAPECILNLMIIQGGAEVFYIPLHTRSVDQFQARCFDSTLVISMLPTKVLLSNHPKRQPFLHVNLEYHLVKYSTIRRYILARVLWWVEERPRNRQVGGEGHGCGNRQTELRPEVEAKI